MSDEVERLINQLDSAVDERDADFGIRIEGGFEFAWSAEVRVTRWPNVRGQPDESIVFYQAGGGTPDECLVPALTAALGAVRAWTDDPDPPRWSDGPSPE